MITMYFSSSHETATAVTAYNIKHHDGGCFTLSPGGPAGPGGPMGPTLP